MVTAAAPDEPKALLGQLKPNGILVAPIGKGPVQSLRRYTGDGKGGFDRRGADRRALRARCWTAWRRSFEASDCGGLQVAVTAAIPQTPSVPRRDSS